MSLILFHYNCETKENLVTTHDVPLGETILGSCLFCCYVNGFKSKPIYFPTTTSFEKHWDRDSKPYINSAVL
jgi:hypothetical protein